VIFEAVCAHHLKGYFSKAKLAFVASKLIEDCLQFHLVKKVENTFLKSYHISLLDTFKGSISAFFMGINPSCTLPQGTA